MKKQAIVHTYGYDEDEWDIDESREQLQQCMSKGAVPHTIPPRPSLPDDVIVTIGGKKCKCGSTTHQWISHRECPLNKKIFLEELPLPCCSAI